jgi:nitrite reductase/ring-hydroxylating ferredoxin subunit
VRLHRLRLRCGGLRVVCPWHGFEFSVRTGRHPASARIKLLSFRCYLSHQSRDRRLRSPALARLKRISSGKVSNSSYS